MRYSHAAWGAVGGGGTDRTVRKGTIGSSFDDFLKEEGIYETVQVAAIKRVLAWQLEQAMAAQELSKSEMARRMNTSRSQLDRLLDPHNIRVQLDTVMKAAAVLGKEFRMALVDRGRKVAFYDRRRPHSAPDRMTPAQYAGRDCRSPRQPKSRRKSTDPDRLGCSSERGHLLRKK